LNPPTEELRTKAKIVADLHFTGDLAHETAPYRPETEDGDVVSITSCDGWVSEPEQGF